MGDYCQDDRRKMAMVRLIRTQQEPGPLSHRNAIPTDKCG